MLWFQNYCSFLSTLVDHFSIFGRFRSSGYRADPNGRVPHGVPLWPCRGQAVRFWFDRHSGSPTCFPFIEDQLCRIQGILSLNWWRRSWICMSSFNYTKYLWQCYYLLNLKKNRVESRFLPWTEALPAKGIGKSLQREFLWNAKKLWCSAKRSLKTCTLTQTLYHTEPTVTSAPIHPCTLFKM